jgi:hypothetical protein
MKKMILLALVAAWLPLSTQAGTPEEDKKLIESLKKDYPTETCVVSGDKLGEMGDPIDYLYTQKVDGKEQTRLVRFCCKGCIKSFKKEPAKFLKKLDEAAETKKR